MTPPREGSHDEQSLGGWRQGSQNNFPKASDEEPARLAAGPPAAGSLTLGAKDGGLPFGAACAASSFCHCSKLTRASSKFAKASNTLWAARAGFIHGSRPPLTRKRKVSVPLSSNKPTEDDCPVGSAQVDQESATPLHHRCGAPALVRQQGRWHAQFRR